MTEQRIEWLLWGSLCALLLVPVWGFGWFPTQDGPSHVENANILLQLARGSAGFSDWFVLNTAPTPNWLGHAVMAGLIAIVSGPVAERILLTVCVVGLPLSVRYALGGLRADGGSLAILAFPLSFNCLLHYGFYNFCLSLVLFFVVLGLWLRGARSARLAPMLVLLYGCHVVSWSLALLAMAIYRPREMRRLAVAAVPSIALAVWFFAPRAGGGTAMAAVPFGARWYGLTHFTTAVFSYTDVAQRIGAAVAIFFVLTAVAAFRRRVAREPVLFSSALLVLYFAAPQGAAGGSSLLERLNLFFFLSLILWAGTVEWSAAWRWSLSTGAGLFTVVVFALNVPWYTVANRQAVELLSTAPHIPTGSVFVPLLYDVRGPGPLQDLYGEPIRHLPGYLAAMRTAINLDNYEAQTEVFPVKFRDGRNPAVMVGDIEANPPRVRLDSPLIDCVIVWDPERKSPAIPARFELVYRSPHGSARVYRRYTAVDGTNR